jgi:hypothetical protein
MDFPTPECVEAADAVQLLRWHRFLPQSGMSAVDNPCDAEFHAAIKREGAIIRRIWERLAAFGGITPEISQAVGWEEPICERRADDEGT